MDIFANAPASPPRRAARTRLAASSALAGSLALMLASSAYALPTAGVVAAGQATIAAAPGALTINQSSQNAVLNWQSFSIGQGEAVTFVQPDAHAVALNRVLGSDPSAILGRLSANGQVFLVNPSGVLFGEGAQVNVGGLVASTLGIKDADFMAGRYGFFGASAASVVNQGSITADGGSVALLGAHVSNRGVISARLGAVSLAAGSAVTLDVAGDGLLNVTVDAGAVDALAENGGLIQADGGRVLMTARSAGALLRTAVNNTGLIEARTIENRNGAISLMGDMQDGAVNVNGTLDASALQGGDGGSIETSAARVTIADQAKISTAAPLGVTGTWLIDPQDFTIGAGGNISGATLSALLVTNSVTITTATGPDATVAGTPPVTTKHTASPGNGDITVNDAVSWTATPSTTTLRLIADRDVNVNKAITATNGNVAICCGRDANLNASVTTTNGSLLVSAGHNVTLAAVAAITVTDGNITLCAGHDLNVMGAVTLTRGSSIPAQSLGLTLGMLLVGGYDGTGPGVAGGTLVFGAGAPPVTVTGPNAPVTINYNPPSYSAPADYLPKFTLTGGATLSQHMLLFPKGDKAFDGTTTATLVGFNTTAASGLPAGVTLVQGPGATAVFDTAAAGSNIGITYSGYSLGGPNAAQFALAQACCTAVVRTTGTISGAAPPPVSPPPPPPPPPPPVSPPPPPVSPPPPPVSPPPPVIVTSTPVASQVSSIPVVVVRTPTVFTLAVLGGGMRMPSILVAEAQPAPVIVTPQALPAPAVEAPAPKAVPYVAPFHPRKQARN